MNKYDHRFPRRDQHLDEENVVAEILEDIECLDLVDSENDNTDLLNDDTFGDFGDSQWDPTETFMEAERLKNTLVSRPRRTSTVLEKFNDFDFFLKKKTENRTFKKELNFRKREPRRKSPSPHPDESTDHEERIWEDDLRKLKDFGLFEITPDYVDLISHKTAELPERFKVSQRTIERHVRCVERNERTYESEFFMNSNEFDRILRIQLAQVSKDPKLQKFSGRWNLYHLGVKKKTEEDSGDSSDEKTDQDESKKAKNRPNRFGRSSTTSIRHGRKLIYLGGDSGTSSTSPESSDYSALNVNRRDRDNKVRYTIENCYETLYVLCDVENEIEKCPMNHVSALGKMQNDRDEYLRDLFTLLTCDLDVFTGILDLNKGRSLTCKVGRKLGIENKLLLLCTILGCLDKFVEICRNVDKALENEPNLSSFVELATNSHNLKSLVAFEGSGDEFENTTEGSRIQHLLFSYNSYTRLFLFVVEGISLTGHLFLLTGRDGRHTALQRCSNLLILGQQKSKGFETVLTTRSGVLFTNIFLQRVRTNQGAVDQNTVDIILHYTLDISEHIESNQQEWNSLASNIVKMF